MTKFFASKRIALAMALLASILALSSLLSFLPSQLHILLHGLTVGFAVGLSGFFRAFSDDLNRHKPWSWELLTKSFIAAYCLFLLFICVIIVKDFSRPH